MDFYWPIIMDNQNLRKRNPYIAEHFKACEQDLQDFKKENGVIRDIKNVDWIDCPVCGSSESDQFIVKWGGRYDECRSCTHIFLRNPLKEERLLELYKTSIADQMDRKVQLNSFNQIYWQNVYEKYMSHISHRLRSDARIIDIGCGLGQFLKYCSEKYSYNLFALDVYSGLAEQVSFLPKENVFEVDSFTSVKLDYRFSLVTLWGVVEHLRNPHTIIDWCANHIDENGLVLMLLPNIHSRARKILGVYTPTLNPREHIHFFTRESLDKVVHHHGFRIMSHSQELPIIDIMWDFVDADTDIIRQIVDRKECYYDVYILERM